MSITVHKYFIIMELTDIPSEVIIYVILPYLQYEYNTKGDISIKALFGYFKLDCNRIIWLIWRGLYCSGLYSKCTIKLIEYPHLISLEIKYCLNISELKEYPLLTSLSLWGCKYIHNLKEYPILTSLKIYDSKINELTPLGADGRRLRGHEEYPLLIFLEISDCAYLEDIRTENKKEIQKYAKKYISK